MRTRMTSVMVRGAIASALAVLFGASITVLVFPREPIKQPDLALIFIVLLAFMSLSLAATGWSAFALLAAARSGSETRLRQAALARRIAWASIILTPTAGMATAILLGDLHNDHRLIGMTLSALAGPVVVPAVLLLGQGIAIARVAGDSLPSASSDPAERQTE